MPQRKSITSIAEGLSSRGVFLPHDKNLLWVRAPDWSGSKAAQVWTSFEDVAGSYAPEVSDVGGSAVISVSSDQNIVVEGPCYVRLHLTNPGTGVSFVFSDPYASNDNDQGDWLMALNVWNDFGVWLDSSSWSES